MSDLESSNLNIISETDRRSDIFNIHCSAHSRFLGMFTNLLKEIQKKFPDLGLSDNGPAIRLRFTKDDGEIYPQSAALIDRTLREPPNIHILLEGIWNTEDAYNSEAILRFRTCPSTWDLTRYVFSFSVLNKDAISLDTQTVKWMAENYFPVNANQIIKEFNVRDYYTEILKCSISCDHNRYIDNKIGFQVQTRINLDPVANRTIFTPEPTSTVYHPETESDIWLSNNDFIERRSSVDSKSHGLPIWVFLKNSYGSLSNPPIHQMVSNMFTTLDVLHRAQKD